MRISKRLTVVFTLFCMISSHAGDDNNERRICLDPQNRLGVCLTLKECPHLVAKLTLITKSIVAFFERSAAACGKRKRGENDLYCCRKKRFSCGNIDGKRIAHGVDAKLSEFPWMVQLRYSENEDKGCAGSLIDSKNVLTAAHCVFPRLNATHVLLGDYDKSSIIDCTEAKGIKKCADAPQLIRIENIHRHEDFQPQLGKNDIALITLENPAEVEAISIHPICLPNPKKWKLPKELIIAGWGKMEQGSAAKILQKSNITILNDINCQSLITDADKQFCGHNSKRTATCQGDSGGPVFGIVDNKRYIQYGIITSGTKKCNEEMPSVFVNVTRYLDWIQDKRKR